MVNLAETPGKNLLSPLKVSASRPNSREQSLRINNTRYERGKLNRKKKQSLT